MVAEPGASHQVGAFDRIPGLGSSFTQSQGGLDSQVGKVNLDVDSSRPALGLSTPGLDH